MFLPYSVLHDERILNGEPTTSLDGCVACFRSLGKSAIKKISAVHPLSHAAPNLTIMGR